MPPQTLLLAATLVLAGNLMGGDGPLPSEHIIPTGMPAAYGRPGDPMTAGACGAMEREHWQLYCEANYVACIQGQCVMAPSQKARATCLRICQSRRQTCMKEHCG